MSLERKRRSLSLAAKVGSHETCRCGNVFMPDSIFCRKCGEKRPAPVFTEDSPRRRSRRGESPRKAEFADALRKKDSELRTTQAELSRARAEVQRLTQVSRAKDEDVSRRDASVTGFREMQRMWEQETLALRGKLAACEAEAHREQSIRDAEISRLRLMAEEARHQAKSLKAACKERVAKAQEEVESTRAELLRQVREKDSQLQRQWQDLNVRIEEERQRHAHTQAYETERGRARADSLEVHVRDLEAELTGLRAAKSAAEAKLRALNESWLAAERKSARLLTSSSTATRERDRLAAGLSAEVSERTQAYERQLTHERSAAEALRDAQQRDAQQSLIQAEERWRAEAADDLRKARRQEAAMGSELEAERAATVTLRTEMAAQQRQLQQQLQTQQQVTTDNEARRRAWAEAEVQSLPPMNYRAERPESPLMPAPASPAVAQLPLPKRGSPVPRSSRQSRQHGHGEADREPFQHAASQPGSADQAWSFEDGMTHAHGASPRSPSPQHGSPSPSRACRSPPWSSAASRSPRSSRTRSPSLPRGSPSPVSSRWREELAAQHGALQRAEEVGEACRRKVQLLEEKLERTTQHEQAAATDGAAWRQRGHNLEEQLERAARDRSRERTRATEEQAALRRAQELHQRHQESEQQAAREAQQAQDRLCQVQAEEAVWRQRGRLAEAELERTAHERDRMIEATNELRADLRAAAGDGKAATGQASFSVDYRAGASMESSNGGASFSVQNGRLSDSLLALRERRRQEDVSGSNFGNDSHTSESLVALRERRLQEKSFTKDGGIAAQTDGFIATFGNRVLDSRDENNGGHAELDQACDACGNVYMPDSLYCRRCGKQRTSVPAARGNAGVGSQGAPQSGSSIGWRFGI